jgi:hypothetical protein
MEKEFVPYEQALALKELGFDEKCLGYFTKNSLELREPYPLCGKTYSAILYQQAFRWFREEHKLIAGIFPNNHSLQDNVSYIGYVGKFKKGNVEVYETYEEAELECLKKLIEIVKKQKEDESNIIV